MTVDRQASATCYRHPGRPAPLACTRCGRPICLDDAIDAPVGYLCPECAQQPANVQRVQRRVQRSVAGGVPTVTRVLIGIIAAVFLWDLTASIWREGALFGPLVAEGEWYRIVTSAFLHSGIIHVGFNGYLLYLLGQMLEPSLGPNRFLALYAGGLLGGSLGALLLSYASPTIGASGAVFGLMGGAMAGYRRRGVNPLQTSIGTLVIINLVFTFLVPRVSIGGHLGGLLGGALVGWILFRFETDNRPTGTVIAWVAALGIGAAALWAGVAGPIF